MKTIVCITTKNQWEESLKLGQFTRSTITSTLEEVGYIYATSPDQTMDIIQRFKDVNDILLLLIDSEKVNSPISYEPAPSGRLGLFPHIYGPLNVDAVYEVIKVPRDAKGDFIAPQELLHA